MLFLMACHDVSIGNPCDVGLVLSEPSLYPYSLMVTMSSEPKHFIVIRS